MSDAPAVLSGDAYRAALHRSHPQVTKAEFVEAACRGRKVLDVGCIDHSADNAIAAGDQWLHHRVRAAAASAVGLDILEADAERLNALGYTIVVGDAEAFRLDCRFDVVVGADVIEHLANVGRFLDTARAHLEPGGRLVLTTPNAFALAFTVHAAITGTVPVNDQHVAWYDPIVLQEALHRAGFGVVDFAWLRSPATGPSARSRVLDGLTAPLRRARPMLERNFGVVATPVG